MLNHWDVAKSLNKMVFSIQVIWHKACDPGWHKGPKQHGLHTLWLIFL